MVLNEKQKARILSAFSSGNFNLQNEISNLENEGFTKEDATSQIQAVVRQKLFDEQVNKESTEDYEKLAAFGLIFLGLIGPLFNIENFLWYFFASVLAGVGGYLAYKDKPFGGAVRSFTFVVLIPVFYNWYVSGRSSIIKIELLIPVGLAILLAYPTGWLVSNMLKEKN